MLPAKQPTRRPPFDPNRVVVFDGERYNCGDFRLPTLSKTSFYKSLVENKRNYKSVFTQSELNK